MIVGVAIRGPDIMISKPRPANHGDCISYAMRIGIDPVLSRVGIAADDQGFITHTGRYLTREQAYKYAKRIKQPLIDNPKGALCSENLW